MKEGEKMNKGTFCVIAMVQHIWDYEKRLYVLRRFTNEREANLYAAKQCAKFGSTLVCDKQGRVINFFSGSWAVIK